MINFKVNGIEISAKKGESILDAARRHGIYIPTMCYLPKTTPNASCRMCSVEVEGQDGFVLSCNTPPVEGIEVTTDSETLYKERQNIMKMYNVNHPLQCGVCDKSGECELQNKTLEFEVDEQTFAVRDQYRKKKKWGVQTYDPSLCIMCEKCTAVCNEVVGSSALFIKPGGYKSQIDINLADCISCGECVSVCPVGAMASTDFKYTANAWELKRVPSSCAHCSSACSLYYESKHTANSNREYDAKIYRVTNDADFTSLCGAGRYGFDFENRVQIKDEEAFALALDKFAQAKNVFFTSQITNEEAYLLQKLKEKFGFNLVNEEAKAFQNFMKNFALTAGETLYNATLKDIAQSDLIVTVGASISRDNPMIRFNISQAVKHNKAYVATIHPIVDGEIKQLVTQYIKNEVGSEEAALAMLADTFVEDKSSQKEFFESIDLGYLSGESNISEEEIALLKHFSSRKKSRVLVIGEDVINHPQAANIAKIVGFLQKSGAFKVVINPTNTNTLGVSLLCNLDEQEEGFSIGYNTKADFTLSAKGDGDLDMPALNQQEGTFVNIDKNLVTLNAGVVYKGYELNDIANALLGLRAQSVVEYTSKLGFKDTPFDDLVDGVLNPAGEIVRGYKIESQTVDTQEAIAEVAELGEYNGSVIYSVNPINQFNQFTKDSEHLSDKAELVGSLQFAIAAKISSGDDVKFSVNGTTYLRHFRVDRKLTGTIALNPNFDQDNKSANYRYNQVKIEVTNE